MGYKRGSCYSAKCRWFSNNFDGNEILYGKKILKPKFNYKKIKKFVMDEQLRIILIIIISVAIFGLLVFVYVKNYKEKD